MVEKKLDTPKLLKVIALLILLLLGIGSFGFAALKDTNPITGLVYTLESVAFLHEAEPGAGARALQIFLGVFGAFVFWFSIWTLLDHALEGRFSDYFRRSRAMARVSRLREHYIVCGAGRVGQKIAELLAERKHKFILVDKAMDSKLAGRGFHFLEGDAMDESTLIKAGIKRAKGIIAVLPETEKNVLLTLTAKEINPTIPIYARAEKKEMMKRLMKAGASEVVMPEEAGAKELVKRLLKEQAGEKKKVEEKQMGEEKKKSEEKKQVGGEKEGRGKVEAREKGEERKQAAQATVKKEAGAEAGEKKS